VELDLPQLLQMAFSMAAAVVAPLGVDHLFMVVAAAREQQLELQYMEDLVVQEPAQASYRAEVADPLVTAAQAKSA